jgi:hypothetical protein
VCEERALVLHKIHAAIAHIAKTFSHFALLANSSEKENKIKKKERNEIHNK